MRVPALTSRALVATFVTAVSAMPMLLFAQDVPTVFQHGILADGSTWSNYMAPELRRMLRIAPVQPTVEWWRGYNEQATQLADFLNTDLVASTAATLPFVAHSGGGIVSREYSRLPGSRINRIVTVASPHAGAPIAGNWLNGEILYYSAYAAAAVADPIIFYDLNDWHRIPWWLYRFGAIMANFFYDLPGWVCPAAGVCIDPATQQLVPMVNNVAPGSAYMQALNAAANLNRETAMMPQRFGLYTNFQPINAFFYLISDDPRDWIMVKDVATVFYQEMYQYYVDNEDWFLSANAYRWLDGEATLIDFDAAWQDIIGALVHYNLYLDENTGFYIPQMEVNPNDAFIPNYAQGYPGGINEAVPGNIAHTQQTRSPAVRDRFYPILANQFLLPIRPAGSTASVSISPTSAGIIVGQKRQLTATARDIDGNVVSKAFSWSSSNLGVASVSNTGLVTGIAAGTATIRAVSEGYSSTATIAVANASPLTASISGPISVRPLVECLWYANPNGGVSPYSYSWRVGTASAPSNTYELLFTNFGRAFTVTVTVVDAIGQSVTASKSVSVSSTAGICPY